MGIRDQPISPRSPWQNGIAERLIGALRRECLDQMVICGEAHLRRILSAYAAYYNQARTHLALQKDAPLHRAVQRSGAIVAIPILAGLHHQSSGYNFRKGQGGTCSNASSSRCSLAHRRGHLQRARSSPIRRGGSEYWWPAGADLEVATRLAAFRKALQDLGWVPGNLRVDARFGVNDDDLLTKAKELVGLASDVVLAMGTPSVVALLKVTRTVPIVFGAVTDPVGLGITQSLAHPGGNATGFLTAEFGFGAKSLELLKEVAPRISKVIVLTDLDNRAAPPQFAAIQTVAPSLGVELSLLSMNNNASANASSMISDVPAMAASLR